MQQHYVHAQSLFKTEILMEELLKIVWFNLKV